MKSNRLVKILVCLVIVIVALVVVLGVLVLTSRNEAGPRQDDIIVSEGSSSMAAQEAAQEAPDRAMSEQTRRAKADVESIVGSYGDSVAVCVMPVDGSPGFSINGDERFVSASMIKLAILAEYVDQVSSGALNPDDTYVVQSSDIVGGTGSIQNSGAGASYTYSQLAKHMIAQSDNVATNILIEALGQDAINQNARDLGLSTTTLNRKMMQLNSGVENYVTADECARLLVGIANGSLGGPELSTSAQDYLLAQTDSEGLAQGIPSGARFGHKTGSLDGIRHDGGIVFAQNPYVIVVLTKLDASEANELMARISKAVSSALG